MVIQPPSQLFSPAVHGSAGRQDSSAHHLPPPRGAGTNTPDPAAGCADGNSHAPACDYAVLTHSHVLGGDVRMGESSTTGARGSVRPSRTSCRAASPEPLAAGK